MIRYLLYRPIGTCLTTLTLIVLGLIATKFLPVSLLPDIPIPELTVQANYPYANPRQIQEIVAKPLRNQLLQLNHLDDLEVISTDGQAIAKLRFAYNTDINLAYLEANEKIDLLMEDLPKDMPRPRVIKAGAGDIAVFQLNVRYKEDSSDFLELSNFCDNVLKKRLEQLPEIALVDISGLAKAEVLVQPYITSLHHTGLSIQDLSTLIQSQSGELGNVTLKEGPYEYSISFDTSLRTVKDIENLYFNVGSDIAARTGRRILRLGDVARISIREQKLTGLYTFNGRRAISMAIIKHKDAQLLQLRETVKVLLKTFEKDYPKLDFRISQDQTALLDLSISNLIFSLITGAILSFIMILFFMKDKRVLLFIGLVIPVSLSLTLLGFYLLGISLNVVSIAGLVLGIGEIVDSAIIIIENIEHYRKHGNTSLAEVCIKGTEEVIKPLFTSVLTNSAVFLPLLFLSGIAGALFFDQAIAVSLALGMSLLTSYTLIPVLYYYFFKNRKYVDFKPTLASRVSENLYNWVFQFAMKRPGFMLSCWLILILLSAWVFVTIEKKGMPVISRIELETAVNWNEPLSPEENNNRLKRIMRDLKTSPTETGIYVGQQQFLLNNRMQQSTSEAMVICKVNSTRAFDSLRSEISERLKLAYPQASFESRPALNVFEQLFNTTEAELKILLSGTQNYLLPSISLVDSLSTLLIKNGVNVQPPTRIAGVKLHLHPDKLLLYNVTYEQILQVLRVQLGEDKVGTLRAEERQVPIVLGTAMTSACLEHLISNTFVTNSEGTYIPVRELISYSKTLDYASLYLGKEGTYIPLQPKNSNEGVPALRARTEKAILNFPYLTARYTGKYYKELLYINELTGVIFVAIGMLFFILAAQFESLLQPFIVLLTIVFGVTGALLLLHWTGNSLNIMSAIGLIVLMGLLDNDSILKMDTMNRSRDKYSLMETIRLGGQTRLQSQLMTFFTTELGLLPIIWSSGLGAELQKPLALAVIGGMPLGVLISWTFIPVTYYWLYNKKGRNTLLHLYFWKRKE